MAGKPKSIPGKEFIGNWRETHEKRYHDFSSVSNL
jgi:hypothetical protein